MLHVEFLKLASNFIPHTSKFRHHVFFTSHRLPWVVKPDVKPVLDLPGEDRTGFFRVVADRDDIIKFIVEELIDAFRTFPRNVNANLLHDGDSPGMNLACRKSTCREDLHILVKGFQEPFRHLAAAGVAGANDENFVIHRDSFGTLTLLDSEFSNPLPNGSFRQSLFTRGTEGDSDEPR